MGLIVVPGSSGVRAYSVAKILDIRATLYLMRYDWRNSILEETRAVAVKRVLAWQLHQAMERRHMSKSAMARAMRTSRSQLDRILDPDNDHIRLDTLTAAAKVLGLSLRIELVG